jgi:hypothetical protein
MYSMGIYRLQDEIHQKMDSARENFFWHDPNLKRKYHIAKWDIMASPKSAGGAGFTNTRVMNRCLLAKWLVKIEGGENTLCCNLLKNKYLGENEIFSYKKKKGSQFWKGLMSVRDDIVRGMSYVIGDGKKSRFWRDVCIGNCALRVCFPRLFEICNQQEWTVHKVLRDGGLNLTFRRNFRPSHTAEWEDLVILVEEVNLLQTPDSVKWSIEKSGLFSTTSLYRELMFPGVVNKWMMCIWRAKLPLKIKIFLWQVCNDKIKSAEQLKAKNWNGPLECKLCGEVKSTSHIFLECAVAMFSWRVVSDVVGWGAPKAI